MNKKEQKEFDELKAQLRLAKALRWTSEVKPDIPLPTGQQLAKGFLFNDYIGGWDGPNVAPACSSSVGHCYGSDERTTTQQPRSLYSTKLLALRGLRHAVEQKVAAILAKIDEKIETEQPNG